MFSPYYLELYVGQFTFLTASLVFWAYLAWLPREEGTAASQLSRGLGDGLFGLGVWLKLMPLLYLPLALLRGRWKGAACVVAALGLTSWLYFARHPADWTAFQQINGDPFPTWHAGNQGLMALLYGLVQEQVEPFLILYRVSVAAVCGLLLWLAVWAWQARKQERPKGAEAAGAPEAGGFEVRLLFLYAACSAGYPLLYKDVWEHHYLLLLPPLVLLALRKAPVALWLPPFLIAALPTLFAFYDVRGLGFNEDPQRYWRPAVSLLQHGWKPLSALWLLVGVVWQSLPFAVTAAASRRSGTSWFRPAVGAAMILLLTLGGVGVARWAGGAIAEQKRGAPDRVWAPPIFQMQQRANTCGPAALASVCRYYGIPAEEAEIARRAGTTEAGISMLELQQAAQEKGLSTLARRATLSELAQLPLPCILFFHPGHFAVLTGVHNGHFILADPSRGQQEWTAPQLAYFWRGELLAIGPAEPRTAVRAQGVGIPGR